MSQIRCTPLWVVSGTFALLFATSAEAVPLVRDGRPVATIVVARSALQAPKEDEAADKAAAAAKDFRDYVRKLSGAELPIVGDDTTPRGAVVLIGRSRLTDNLGADIPKGLTPARREEGFLILATDDSLLLAGNDAGPYHGTEYAVAEMLERLGVRWFMPGEFGEYVPHRPTLEVGPLNVRQTPDFILRNWWVHTTPEMAKEERRWKIRNKMNPDEIFAMPGDSSVRKFVADKGLIATRPDLFAKNADGTSNPYLPNLTSADAVKIAAEKIKERFRSDPNLQSIGIAPDDGLPRDFSPETAKRNLGLPDLLGREGAVDEVSASEEWFEFVNAIAREVRKEFPDRIISTNGYANRNTPPQGVTIEPNVDIMFAAIWSDTLHALDDPKSWQAVRQGQMLQRWSELSDKVWIYGYNHTMLVSALTPVPLTRKLARDMPLLKKWGIIGFWDEARNQWAESGITTKYVRARLEWDAEADVDAMLNDYFQHWYGAAAGPAQRFWNELEYAVENTPLLGHEDRILPYVYTPDVMAKLLGYLEEAEKQAPDERSRLHVRVDRLIYEHLKSYVAMSAADSAGDWGTAARYADAMMSLRKQLMDISPFFLLDHEKPYNAGIWYWGVIARGDYYRQLADLTNGKKGDLVALLPEQAQFNVDPYDEGRFAGWNKPEWDTRAWKPVLTTKPFYAQGYMSPEGYPYVGPMWYRFDVHVPARFKGRPVTLLAPVVETEAWVWVNDKYVGHRPYNEAYVRPNELKMDVTKALQPGRRNVITIRVNTGMARAAAAGGLSGRMLLYSPKVPAVQEASF